MSPARETLFSFFRLSSDILLRLLPHAKRSYDGQSKGANITIGVLDSFCGGLLLFAGMSVFWPEWFVTNYKLCLADSLVVPSVGFFGVALGMVIMSVIGIWA